jgi:type III secretion protein S
MPSADVLQLTKEALWLVLLLSMPPVLAASVIGLLVAFAQAVTQLQEQTLAYTAKFVAIIITLFVTATLLGGSLMHYSERIFELFPRLVR